MADEEKTEEEEAKGGGKKKLIIGAVVGLVALGGAYQFVLKPAPAEEPTPEELAMVEPVEGEIHQMEEMILNIEGENGGAYLRIGLAIVLEEGVLAADFAAEQAIASDVAVQYLAALTVEDLRTAEGRATAKEELGSEIRAAYDDEMVLRVLFTSLVMQ